MNQKQVYGIVAVAVIVIAGAIFLNSKGKNEPQSTDNYGNSQNSGEQQTNQENNEQTTMTDEKDNCAPGADYNQKDANGRFKPTVDIANKTAVFDTNMGKIEFELYDKDAPKTVQNFVCLIQKGYYDNVTFHRVAHGFVIQAGDPTGTGAGGESIYGAKFEDELYADSPSYKAGYTKGVLAMANAGPNTNGSQFFVLLSDISLPHAYTIFGKVSSGLETVEKIGAVAITPKMGPEDGTPIKPVIINKATIK